MSRRFAKGFSLIELMIVVTIIAILASLAYYNYARYAFRTRRADGREMVMRIAARRRRGPERQRQQHHRPGRDLAADSDCGHPGGDRLAGRTAAAAGLAAVRDSGTAAASRRMARAARFAITNNGGKGLLFPPS